MKVKENSMTTKVFTVVIHLEEDVYVAQCPEIRTLSQGESIIEAIALFESSDRTLFSRISTAWK
jgi:hypothetical protein